MYANAHCVMQVYVIEFVVSNCTVLRADAGPYVCCSEGIFPPPPFVCTYTCEQSKVLYVFWLPVLRRRLHLALKGRLLFLCVVGDLLNVKLSNEAHACLNFSRW